MEDIAHTMRGYSENLSKLVHGSWLLNCGDLNRCNFIFHIFSKGILINSVGFWADKRTSPIYKTESFKTFLPNVLNIELKEDFKTEILVEAGLLKKWFSCPPCLPAAHSYPLLCKQTQMFGNKNGKWYKRSCVRALPSSNSVSCVRLAVTCVGQQWRHALPSAKWLCPVNQPHFPITLSSEDTHREHREMDPVQPSSESHFQCHLC